MDTLISDSSVPMQIGTEEFRASMFTDKDYGDLDNYIRSIFIRMGVEAAEKLNGSADKVITITLREATKVGWMTPEGNEIMSSIDGIIHLGYQLIRKRHPKISFSQFESLCRGEDNKDLPKSLREINIADRVLNYKQITQKDDGADQGGSAAGNTKS